MSTFHIAFHSNQSPARPPVLTCNAPGNSCIGPERTLRPAGRSRHAAGRSCGQQAAVATLLGNAAANSRSWPTASVPSTPSARNARRAPRTWSGSCWRSCCELKKEKKFFCLISNNYANNCPKNISPTCVSMFALGYVLWAFQKMPRPGIEPGTFRSSV